VVLAKSPHPEGGAADRCAIALIRGLLARGVDCRVLAADVGPVPPPPTPPDLPIEVLNVPLPEPQLRLALERLVLPHRLLSTGRFAARLRELSREADVVHFFEHEASVGLPVVDRPAAVQLHFLTRRDREIRAPWHYEGRVALAMLRAERRATRRARWLIANTPEIARQLTLTAPHAEVTLAPMALDPAGYEPCASLRSPVAGLVGTASWPPTAAAVRRLLARVWPEVLRRRPEARLRLAGRFMERATFPDAPDLPGVEWLGAIPSASDFLRGLGVLLYPLPAGSGTKVKVLESLALGVPVVTTPDGAEGIVGAGGLAVGSDDDALVAATVALLDDGALRHATGRAARQTFLAHHTPVPAAGPVVELYERMVA
jgi:glycosyltransferase involved in cell wall biosynthesis